MVTIHSISVASCNSSSSRNSSPQLAHRTTSTASSFRLVTLLSIFLLLSTCVLCSFATTPIFDLQFHRPSSDSSSSSSSSSSYSGGAFWYPHSGSGVRLSSRMGIASFDGRASQSEYLNLTNEFDVGSILADHYRNIVATKLTTMNQRQFTIAAWVRIQGPIDKQKRTIIYEIGNGVDDT